MHAKFLSVTVALHSQFLWVLAPVELWTHTCNPYARVDTRDAVNGSRKRTAAAACRLQVVTHWIYKLQLLTTQFDNRWVSLRLLCKLAVNIKAFCMQVYSLSSALLLDVVLNVSNCITMKTTNLHVLDIYSENFAEFYIVRLTIQSTILRWHFTDNDIRVTDKKFISSPQSLDVTVITCSKCVYISSLLFCILPSRKNYNEHYRN